MTNFTRRLQLGSSTLALIALSSLGAAMAQDIETVTVTGTSIRGVAPVGSNLQVMTPADIKKTAAIDMQGVLAQNPALMAFGNGTQGATGGQFTSAYQPSIHSLGSSGANSTMVLVDGHRFALSGTNHSEPDPNLIPINMVERVEVLAEGASSTYGSDAIAGVVNIITRNRFEGIELSGQATFYPDKVDEQAGILTGFASEGGWFMFGYSHVHQSELLATDRPWTSPARVQARGGNTAYNFSCDPASIQPTGFSNIYTSATSGVALANTAANGVCSTWQYGSLVPNTHRDNAMIKVSQNFGSKVTMTGDMLIASRQSSSHIARGTIQATAFGAGSQANPFYTRPAGYTGTATSQTIRWDADALLGPGATNANEVLNLFADMNWQYRPNDDWAIDFLALMSRDDSVGRGTGSLNSSAASLGINGSISTSGNTTTAVPNSSIVFNTLPLTTANALDVWNPAATNRTSAKVRSDIANNFQGRDYVVEDLQLRLQANGRLMDLPAGPMKVAFGIEMNRNKLSESGNQSNGSGPAEFGSTYQIFSLPRNIYAAFVEANIPAISPEMNIPLMQKLVFNLSARVDHYSDWGQTQNPKVAFGWEVNDDLNLRGNYSTSFAPVSIDEIGEKTTGLSTLQSYGAPGGLGSVNLPVATFPLVTQMRIPGCTVTSVTCNVSSLTGLSTTTGDKDMNPARGRSWSVGADYNPSWLPGLHSSATLWWVHVKGAVQAVGIAIAANNPSMAFLLKLFPNGATAQDIATATQGILGTAAISPGLDFIYQNKNSDWINLQEQGVDFNLAYTYDSDSWGSFTLSDSASIIMNAHLGYGLHAAVLPGQAYSVTNQSGANSTFSTISNQQRFALDWSMDAFQASVIMNYTGAYRNWSASTITPLIRNSFGNPIGGGDVIRAQKIFNLQASYSFSGWGFGDQQISLTVSNLFNVKPPFSNTSTGVDSRNGSLLQRGVAIGFRTSF